jgi:putative Holliday junction resolvase
MRILGIDPGEKRIGLAIADSELRLARPLQVLTRRSRADDFARLAEIMRAHDVGLIVVGQPLAEDGGAGARARTVERWATALAEAVGAEPPVPAGAVPQRHEPEHPAFVLWDERMSTLEATRIRRAQGKRGHAPVDAVAAAVILQDYLDSVFPRAQRE